MPIMRCLYRQTVNRKQKTRTIKYFGSLGFLILQNIFFVMGLTYGCLNRETRFQIYIALFLKFVK